MIADVDLERRVLSAAFEGVRLDERLTIDHFTGMRRDLFTVVREIEDCNFEVTPRRIAYVLYFVHRVHDLHPLVFEAADVEFSPVRVDPGAVDRLIGLARRRDAMGELRQAAVLLKRDGSLDDVRKALEGAWQAVLGAA